MCKRMSRQSDMYGRSFTLPSLPKRTYFRDTTGVHELHQNDEITIKQNFPGTFK